MLCELLAILYALEITAYVRLDLHGRTTTSEVLAQLASSRVAAILYT